MLYWSRTGSFVDVLQCLGLSAAWALGGWLITRSLFRLRRTERLASGAALGLLVFITLTDLLVPWFGAPAGFWIASGMVLVAGVALAIRRRDVVPSPTEDLAGWPAALGALGVAIAFTLALRGLGLFDDYLHLPLVASMARGNIPPDFYLDPDLHFAYHYGLQVLSASITSVGGFFPWSAWDLGRGLALGLTAALGWLWMRRMTGSRAGGWLGALLVCLGGGTRWILLALPPAWLDRMASGLTLQPTALMAGSRLSESLRGMLYFQGGGPVPFPFAVTNTDYPPLNYHLGSSGALPNLGLLLLLLLAGAGRLTPARAFVIAILLSGLGLSGENAYAAVFLGLVFVFAAGYRTLRRSPARRAWVTGGLVVLAVSAALVLVQGGFITEAALSAFSRWRGAGAEASANLRGFGIRWPPAMFSGHLGSLGLLNPGTLAIALAELGPVLLLAAPVTALVFRRGRPLGWMIRAMAIGALVSFVFPLFFSYGLDRSITRLPETALWIWSVLGFQIVFRAQRRWSASQRGLAGLAYAATVAAGVVILVVELAAIPSPQLSYFITYGDAKISRDFWDRIGPQDMVFDVLPERSVALFGRSLYASQDVYLDQQTALPVWLSLQLDPQSLLQAGYTYLYLDEDLSPQTVAAFEVACVDEVDVVEFGPVGEMRRLLDLSGCR
jgi:hypothetical protein